jgi:curved DNA-binding protein CbpA
MKNYYDILGVSKTSSQEEIKKKYRELSKMHHPDKGGDEEMFKKINEAYSTLSDPSKRAEYDNPVKTYSGGMSAEDVYNMAFGRQQRRQEFLHP